MPALATIPLQTLITQQAIAQGVPPEIALGVAQTESGIAQWTQNGNIVTSSAGALGVFQLMPSTAAGLGVDPTDLNGNIAGGITYLKQLYAKFGNWSDALAAYNWGPGNVSAGNSIPTSVGRYVSDVLSSAANFAAGLLGVGSQPIPNSTGTPSVSVLSDVPAASGVSADQLSVLGVSPNVIAVGAILAAGALAWLWRD